MCLKLLFGFDNLPVVYVLFTVIQVGLSINGFKGIKWLENVSCVFLIGILAYMLYVVNTKFSVEIGERFANIEGTWGMPFWAATTAFLGIYSTMILNASDYSRHVKRNNPNSNRCDLCIINPPCNLIYGFNRVVSYGSYRQ